MIVDCQDSLGLTGCAGFTGLINWTLSSLWTNLSLSEGLFLEDNLIGLVDNKLPRDLNGTASIQFYGLDYLDQPFLLKNGVRCDNTVYCNVLYLDGVLFAKVSSFSNYTTRPSVSYLTYDENGNLLSGDGFNRTYNGLNQLTAIYDTSSGDLLEDFVYHPIEERVLVKNVYSGGELIEAVYYIDENFVTVSNSSGNYDYTYVIHEGQLVAEEMGGVKKFIHPDMLGILLLLMEELFLITKV